MPRMPPRRWSGPRSMAPAIEAAVAAAVAITDPASDLRGPADFRKHVAGVMVRRAIESARAPRHGRQLMAKHQIKLTVNGRTVEALVETAPAADPLPARGAEPDRRAHRLRDHPLRRLHGRHGRALGQELHAVRGPGRRRRDHDRRRARLGRRPARAPGGLHAGARAAVRLLHAGHDHAQLPAAAGEPRSDGGRDPDGPVGQPLPLHRLSEHRQGGPLRRRQACRQAKEAAER